jgi:hypothetical protein
MRAARRLQLGAALVVLAGCGSRGPYWDTPISQTPTPIAPIGLANGVVLVDDEVHRALVLTATADHSLATTGIPIGHGYTTSALLPDGTKTLMLSAGDWPRKTTKDQWPSLTILGIDARSSTHPVVSLPLELAQTQPQSTLAVDQEGRYVVAYQGPGATQTYATNPNEIVIFDLGDATHPGCATTPPVAGQCWRQRTIRSFGGTPQRLTFGPPMMLPAGAANATERRLLFVETTIDVTMIDLYHAFDHAFDHQAAPDITIRLTNGSDTRPVTPAGIAIDTAKNDGRFALRTKEGSNVYTVQLVPTAPSDQAGDGGAPNGNDFTPTINLTDVGGVPSDIAFVNTFQGLRVAALVPSKSEAVLLEPDTSVTTQVSLASPYSRMSLVTDIVLPTQTTSAPDVAMLWAENASSPGIGLWTLGNAVGQPYRSVEVLSVEDPIASVMDLPDLKLPIKPDPVTNRTYQQNLKILQTSGSNAGASFYVLNLVDRTASPLLTMGTPTLSVAPDGERVWAYTANGTDLAQFDLANLNPLSLTTEQPIAAVFDVGEPGVFVDPEKTIPERTLIAIHNQGSFGATLFDAKRPDTATSHQSVALLLEGP